GGTSTTTTDSQQAAQDRQAEMVDHTRISTHTIEADGHAEEHWDGNGDGIPDHTHPIGTASHH
ncbi:MAG: hypothetical protein HYZ88_00445, partial [Candidatus Omnitrophica bacterium]|nr:hypothetical protein [Candidatus Omnitrophota bacterium]